LLLAGGWSQHSDDDWTQELSFPFSLFLSAVVSPLGITPDLAAVSVNVDDYTVLERAVIMTAVITDNQPQSLEEPERTRYGRQSAAPKMPEHKNVFSTGQ